MVGGIYESCFKLLTLLSAWSIGMGFDGAGLSFSPALSLLCKIESDVVKDGITGAILNVRAEEKEIESLLPCSGFVLLSSGISNFTASDFG